MTNIAKKLGKAAVTLTGAGLFKGAYDHLSSDANALKNRGKSLNNEVRSAAKQQSRTSYESFEQMVIGENASEAQLQKRYANLRAQYFVFMAGVLLAPFLIATSFNAGFPSAAFGTIGISALMLAKAIKASYYAWQIKHKKLVRLKDWAQDPANWIPRR
ncbi:MAG: hypothetical protein OEY58_19320 [Gammaproteobacteria bacterium]|nr:hypothetical protein [Gammaproteobacteria bacterium]